MLDDQGEPASLNQLLRELLEYGIERVRPKEARMALTKDMIPAHMVLQIEKEWKSRLCAEYRYEKMESWLQLKKTSALRQDVFNCDETMLAKKKWLLRGRKSRPTLKGRV